MVVAQSTSAVSGLVWRSNGFRKNGKDSRPNGLFDTDDGRRRDFREYTSVGRNVFRGIIGPGQKYVGRRKS